MKVAGKQTIKTSHAYNDRIQVLKRKRNEIKVKLMNSYGWNGYTGVATNKQLPIKAYILLTAPITKKIANLNRSYKKIKDKQKIVKKAATEVEAFFEIKLKSGKMLERRPVDKVELGRWILSKYIIELGIDGLNGRHVANHLDCRVNNPSMWRRKLTRSFETNKYNKDKWDQFLVFMNGKNPT